MSPFQPSVGGLLQLLQQRRRSPRGPCECGSLERVRADPLRREPHHERCRHFSRPSEGYFSFFNSGGAPLAVLVNADLSKGSERILYAVNPTMSDVVLSAVRRRATSASSTAAALPSRSL